MLTPGVYTIQVVDGVETAETTIEILELSDPIPEVDIEVTKSADKTTVLENETVVFTITATNNGPDDATGITITEMLPSGLSFVSSSTSTGSYDPVVGIWFVGDFPAGTTAQLEITAQAVVGAGGLTVTNTASLTAVDQTDVNPSNDSSSVDVSIVASDVDVEVIKTADTTSPTIGGQVVFTITATNNGPNFATNIAIIDAMSNGLTAVSASTSQGDYSILTGFWDAFDLAPGASAQLFLTADVNEGTGLTEINQATLLDLDQTDTDPSNNSSFVTLTPIDATPPVITLLGDNPQIINLGENYSELGASAFDDVDQDISNSIIIDVSAVDTSITGSYTVTYDVTDSAGNHATQVTRTVNVVVPSDTLIVPSGTTLEINSFTSITNQLIIEPNAILNLPVATDYFIGNSVECTDGGSINIGGDSSLTLGAGVNGVFNSCDINVNGRGSVNVNDDGSLSVGGTGSVNVNDDGTVNLNGNGSVNVNDDGTVNVKGTGSVNLTEDGSVNLNGRGSVNLTEDGSVNLNGRGSVNLTDNGSLSAGGTGSVNLNDDTSVNLNGNGSVNVNDDGAMSVSGRGSVNLNDNSSIFVGGTGSVNLNDDVSVNVNGRGSVNLNDNSSMSVSGRSSVNLNDDGSMSVSGTGSLNLTDDSSFNAAGGASLILNQGSDVTINFNAIATFSGESQLVAEGEETTMSISGTLNLIDLAEGIFNIILNNISSDTLNNNSMVSNFDTINNFGNYTNNGVTDNFDTFNNLGTLNNLGIFNNHCGATFNDSGAITGNPVENIPCSNLDIDINPGSDENPINLESHGVISVAVLSTESFDATALDLTSLQFGPGQAGETHNKLHIEDVNGDRLDDVVLHFNTQEIGIDETTTELSLTGTTSDGIPVKGSGDVTIKGKKILEN